MPGNVQHLFDLKRGPDNRLYQIIVSEKINTSGISSRSFSLVAINYAGYASYSGILQSAPSIPLNDFSLLSDIEAAFSLENILISQSNEYRSLPNNMQYLPDCFRLKLNAYQPRFFACSECPCRSSIEKDALNSINKISTVVQRIYNARN